MIPHSREFRKRRGMNWLVLGLTYSTMYMGRYNLALVNPLLSKTYGWDKTQIGGIITPALLAYGIFAVFNGPIADRIGGRKAILWGAFGTVCCNIAFGLGSYFDFLGTGGLLLGYFATVWMMNAYFQSFGAVSLIKVNSAWFHLRERGVFSAVFGSMIQLGRTLIYFLGPLVMAAFSWKWVFFIPSMLIACMALMSFFVVQDAPENCGLPELVVQEELDESGSAVSIRVLLKRIFTHPVTLAIAVAEFCTGFVRQGFEQWFPRYMMEVQHLPFESGAFQKNALAIVAAGILGSLIAGTLSDWVFQGRRTPVAFLGYMLQLCSLTVVWRAPGLNTVIAAFILNSCAISMVQSMLSGTASMDFGGKKASATAAGLFDGMQYIGGSFVGFAMGWILEHWGWTYWGPSMMGFSAVGALLMLSFWRARPDAPRQARVQKRAKQTVAATVEASASS